MPTAGELREMEEDVLIRHLRTARQELFGLRFRHATGELENTAGMRSARRELARALTVARERGLDPERTLPSEPKASE
jgi:large subunit ribosomal protein L29